MSKQLSRKEFEVLSIANHAKKTESSFEVGIHHSFKWIETHPQMKVFEMASYISNLIEAGYLATDVSVFDIGETYCSKYDNQVDDINYDNLVITDKGKRAIPIFKLFSIFGFNQTELAYLKAGIASLGLFVLGLFFLLLKSLVISGLH